MKRDNERETETKENKDREKRGVKHYGKMVRKTLRPKEDENTDDERIDI